MISRYEQLEDMQNTNEMRDMTNSPKELFEVQKKSLDHFFEHINFDEVDELLRVLFPCKGVIFFSGVGKSGLVAKKIAVTLTSVGTKSLYLSPVDSLHGDLGIVSKEDIFVFLSKSGESDELLNLIPYLRNKGVYLVCWTSHPKSRLAKGCDLVITLPVDKELCPFDLSPTTSSVVQMIFGNVISVALMQMKHFPIEQFRLNHPAGKIGRRMTLKVKDLMLSGSKIPICHAEDKLMDILVELSDKRCGCLLVVDKENRLLGIFTDGDLRRALQKQGSLALEVKIKALMTKSPKSSSPEVLAVDALSLMEADPKHPVTVLPVLDENKKVLGLIKMHDIVQSGL